jgi:hypothetical protein
MRITRAPLFLAAAFALVSAPRLAAQSADTETRVGAFDVKIEHDRMDDTEYRSLTTDDTAGGPMQLQWSCYRGQPAVSVFFGKYLGGDDDDQVTVQYRFDGATASQARDWDMLSDHLSASRGGRDALRMTETAKQSRQMVVLVIDPLDSETLQGVFSLDGLDAALQKITPCPRF